jgi:hypothetical protein
MIKITNNPRFIPEDDWNYWSFPIEELDYVLEEHEGQTFCLKDGRLYECDEEAIAEYMVEHMREI